MRKRGSRMYIGCQWQQVIAHALKNLNHMISERDLKKMKLLLLLPALLAVSSAAGTINATVYVLESRYVLHAQAHTRVRTHARTHTHAHTRPFLLQLVEGVVDKEKGAAYGFYTPSQNETG